MVIAPDGSESVVAGRTDWSEVDAKGEREIELHARQDDREAVADAAAAIRRMRERTGLSEADFAARIGVSRSTLRMWESGRRLPQGPAQALLRIIDRAPRTALRALERNPFKPSTSPPR
ncbi:MAG: helix-turn-helix domain-containing protein [Geminicoccaceae bacterium]|nr:helix-turn-helix domain-containing protein [Geminicoccaceae bacterium]